MSELQQTARRARRRLWLNRWLDTLGRSLAVAAGLFVAVVVVERLWVAADAGEFYGWLALSLPGAALVASLVWSGLTRSSLTQAAARLDEAAGLKERISSGLHCDEQPDPFARAVVADAAHASRGISVQLHLPVVFPNSGGYAGGLVVLALLAFWLFPTVDLAGKQEERQEEEERRDLVERTRAEVEPAVKQRVQEIRRKNPALDKELAGLEQFKDTRIEKPSDLRTEPIKRINKVGEKLDDRRDSVDLGKVEAFKKLARRLAAQQKLNSSVGKLARGLKSDLKTAREALDEIKKELAKIPKTPEEKKQAEELRKQVEQLSAKLEQIAREQRKARNKLADAGLTPKEIKQALDNLEKNDLKSIEETLKSKGMPPEQLSKLMQEMSKCKAACSAASKLAKNLNSGAASGQGSGEMSASAMAAFSEAAEQLSEMEALEQELNQIDSAMADLESLKQELTKGCSACRGTGKKNGKPCSACQGTGMKCSGGGEGEDPGPGQKGKGTGRGGVAAREPGDTSTVKDKAKVHTLPGKIISTKFVDGEPVIGELSPEFVGAAAADHRRVTDAIASDELPRIYHRGVKNYFDHSFGRLVDEAGGQSNETGGSEN